MYTLPARPRPMASITYRLGRKPWSRSYPVCSVPVCPTIPISFCDPKTPWRTTIKRIDVVAVADGEEVLVDDEKPVYLAAANCNKAVVADDDETHAAAAAADARLGQSYQRVFFRVFFLNTSTVLFAPWAWPGTVAIPAF